MIEEADLPAPDAPIADDTCVFRLVPTQQCEVVSGAWEFTSSAFDNATPRAPDEHPDDMSVVLEDTLDALGREPGHLPERWPESERWGVARLCAGNLTHDEEQAILRTPQSEEPAHGDVRGTKNGNRRKRLKKQARWVVRPAAPPPTSGG